MSNEKIYFDKSELLTFLGLRENFLYSDFSKKYTKLEKLKKSGGIRIIRPPVFKLKKLQRNILDSILYKAPQLSCVYGLSKNKNIINNAKVHHENALKQLVNLDIEDFFPSVTTRRVKKIFIQLGFGKENAAVVTKICTVENALPQGAPTSPYLASMSCKKLDQKLFALCKKKGQIYTRYFDDITISGPRVSKEDIALVESIIVKNGFRHNDDKKQFFGTNEEKIVNGILIRDKDFSVPLEYKQKIKEAYDIYVKTGADKDKRSFSGKLGFYLYLNRKEAETFRNELIGGTV